MSNIGSKDNSLGKKYELVIANGSEEDMLKYVGNNKKLNIYNKVIISIPTNSETGEDEIAAASIWMTDSNGKVYQLTRPSIILNNLIQTTNELKTTVNNLQKAINKQNETGEQSEDNYYYWYIGTSIPMPIELNVVDDNTNVQGWRKIKNNIYTIQNPLNNIDNPITFETLDPDHEFYIILPDVFFLQDRPESNRNGFIRDSRSIVINNINYIIYYCSTFGRSTYIFNDYIITGSIIETEPTGDIEPTGATEPTGEIEPTGDIEPTGVTEPTGEIEPTGDSEPTGATEPTGDIEPTGATEPTGDSYWYVGLTAPSEPYLDAINANLITDGSEAPGWRKIENKFSTYNQYNPLYNPSDGIDFGLDDESIYYIIMPKGFIMIDGSGSNPIAENDSRYTTHDQININNINYNVYSTIGWGFGSKIIFDETTLNN